MIRFKPREEKTPLGKEWEAAALNAAVCFLFLLYWELLTYFLSHSGFSRFTLWTLVFLPSLAFLFSCAAGAFRKRLWGRVMFAAAVLLLTVFYTADAVYCLCFGSLFSVSMMGMGGQAMGDFMGPALITMRDNLFLLLLFVLPFIGLMVFYAVTGRRDSKHVRVRPLLRLGALAMSALLWIGAVSLLPLGGKADHTAYGAYHSRFVDTDTASAKIGALPNTLVETGTMLFGSADEGEIEGGDISGLEEKTEPQPQEPAFDTSPYTNTSINFGTLSLLTKNKKIQSLCSYFSGVKPTNRNRYTGLLEGYNLIYICAESFSSMCVDKEVTPTLYRLASGGIVCSNYYNSFKNTTTNGEYAFLTGIWPDVSRDAARGSNVGSMAQSARKAMPTALGNVFNSAMGVSSRGYHNFRGSYYYRDRSLPNFGFTCKFLGSGMTFTTAWPASDLEMMEQSVGDYVNSEEPFCAYYMTFSGHGTYSDENPMVVRNWSWVKEKAGDRGLSSYAMGYLAANREFDRAMEYLLDELEKAGQLDRTLIVIAGDHYPYYVSKNNRDDLCGYEVDEEFGMYESTLVMWTASMEKEPLRVDVPCCSIDILPTVLNLLGIDFDSRLYAGTDIFSDSEHMAVLYNRNFITDKVKYNNATGEAEWLIDTSRYTEQELQDYLDSHIAAVKARYQASVGIGDTDFYRFVWENSGL